MSKKSQPGNGKPTKPNAKGGGFVARRARGLCRAGHRASRGRFRHGSCSLCAQRPIRSNRTMITFAATGMTGAAARGTARPPGYAPPIA
ncbi:MAG: hypothetical protein U0Z44_19375 [Kouleothrix sp.]